MTINVSAKIDVGIQLTDESGAPLFLTVVDSDGRVVAIGPEVANVVFKAAVTAYDNFWQSNGRMTTILPLETH